jgi:hypothetical protein
LPLSSNVRIFFTFFSASFAFVNCHIIDHVMDVGFAKDIDKLRAPDDKLTACQTLWICSLKFQALRKRTEG